MTSLVPLKAILEATLFCREHSCRPLVFKGFTRTKDKHIAAGHEKLKEDHQRQIHRMAELEAENDILKHEIAREIGRGKKHVAGGAPEFKIRVREEANLKSQADLLRKDIERVEEEILKVKKSQRYSTYQELRVYVEELLEESFRLKKLCKHMRATKLTTIMKMKDRMDVQERLMETRELKLNEFTKDLDRTKEEIKQIEKAISTHKEEETNEQKKLKELETEIQSLIDHIKALSLEMNIKDGAKPEFSVEHQRFENERHQKEQQAQTNKEKKEKIENLRNNLREKKYDNDKKLDELFLKRIRAEKKLEKIKLVSQEIMKSPVKKVNKNTKDLSEYGDFEPSEEEVPLDPDDDEEDRLGMEKDRFWESREEAISRNQLRSA